MHKSLSRFILTTALVLMIGVPAYSAQYFESEIGFSAGSYPTGIASADFNGDSIPDLAVANSIGKSISVLLGNGNGTFATRVNYQSSVAQNFYNVALGDMDGDGEVDIITGGGLSIYVFYGIGDGTFGPSVSHYIGQQTLDLVVADFDHDLDLDIATSHAVRDSVGIHINDGDSTYTTHNIATGDGTISLAVGKLDGDDYDDILVGCNQGVVWNLKNDQAGSFIPTEVHIGILTDPASIAITDLNGDGIYDFGITHSVNDYFYTYLNNGDGTYSIDKAYVLSDNPKGFIFADVNLDGYDDALISIGSTDLIDLYLNDGSRNFIYDSSYSAEGAPRGMVYTDLNDDSYPDLAVASYTTDKAVILKSRIGLILSVDDVDTDGILPIDFALEQNYPNPFNPETRIRFSLPAASHVRLEVFNVLGQSVLVLVDEELSAGVKEVSWNGANAAGMKVTSGLYFYRLATEDFSTTKKMVLIK